MEDYAGPARGICGVSTEPVNFNGRQPAAFRLGVTHIYVTDRAGALAMFEQSRADLSRVQNVMADGGYTGKPFAPGQSTQQVRYQ